MYTRIYMYIHALPIGHTRKQCPTHKHRIPLGVTHDLFTYITLCYLCVLV